MSALSAYPGFASLPEAGRTRFRDRPAPGPFHSATWFRLLAETCPDPGACDLILEHRMSGVLAVLRERRGRRREIEALGNFYTCEYSPLLGRADQKTAAGELVGWLDSQRPRVDLVHLQNLRADQVDTAALASALRAAGWGVQIYEQFGNWFEPVAGLDYASWLAARDGQLRSTIERKTRRFMRLAGASLEIVDAPDALEGGLAAYLAVHARSWKEPEPYPEFIPAFVRRFGAGGHARIGVATAEGRPLAAQIWLRWGARLTIAKLAYDDAAKALSPGTVLTAHMLRAALDAGGCEEIDLGRGDDPYKRLWLKQRRPVLGLVAGNLRSPMGLAAAARHLGPATARRWLERLRRVLRPDAIAG